MALEDLCCHSQKMFILVPPSCPYIHSSTILASPAIDHSMPESFRVHSGYTKNHDRHEVIAVAKYF